MGKHQSSVLKTDPGEVPGHPVPKGIPVHRAFRGLRAIKEPQAQQALRGPRAIKAIQAQQAPRGQKGIPVPPGKTLLQRLWLLPIPTG